ncbi:MAG: PAS domain-containing sensor histidine kinase [Nocardioidaceae bacterium]|nr:PAS domain-containing sensor histidine kinase [Nocardioidaceae bacterium]
MDLSAWLPQGRGGLGRGRRLGGFAVAVAAPALLTAALVPARDQVNLASDMLLFLLTTVAVALVGGLGPALVAAVLSSGLINFYFTAPLHTLSIHDANNAIALVVFVLVAVLVSWTVHLVARFSDEAADTAALAAGNEMRTALLAAAGHDLRAPLAAAKASVSSLRGTGGFTDEDRVELLAAADESLDRLADLVENLLDMSRLQTGALTLALEPTALEEVVTRSLHAFGLDPHRIDVEDGDRDLPMVSADPGLLERVLANLLTNAVRYSPYGTNPELRFEEGAQTVRIRVVDHGPGIPAAARDRVFLPFQRLGDTDNTTGIGLGLAVARGLTEAMAGTLVPEETPGGGLTMVLTLTRAAEAASVPGRREREGVEL